MKIFQILITVAVSAFVTTASAQTPIILHIFVGDSNDGRWPWAGLLQGTDGNFYGTTFGGGKSNCPNGCGTIFRITPSGNYTNLYSFTGSPGDGYEPEAKLVQGSDENLYGTTSRDGMHQAGTVFRISPSGNYTNLHSFTDSPNEGFYPQAGLIEGSDGNLYGTTVNGGAYGWGGMSGGGTVFRISPTGSFTNLYSFGGYSGDGLAPMGGLVEGIDCNFYGTTELGGTSGNGTVFRITPSGSLTILWSFIGHPNDGANPYAGLVKGADGFLYGTTRIGGTNDYGTIFRISLNGSYTNLYSFCWPAGGINPQAALVQGSDGNLYGTTYFAGTYGAGTIFRISPSGTYTDLYSFAGPPNDGGYPYAGLVQGIDGNFYGTTTEGGSNLDSGYGIGTVFKFALPLNPPANQISAVQLLSLFGSIRAATLIPSVAGNTYQLQYTDSLSPTNWINVGDSVLSIGGPLIFTDFSGSLPEQRFYRALIRP